MTKLTPEAEGVTPDTISRMMIKEMVSGIPVIIKTSKSELYISGSPAINLEITSDSEEAIAFFKPFEESIKGMGKTFKSIEFTCIWLDPNPLGIAPMMIDSVEVVNNEGQKGMLFFETIQKVAMSLGWMAPLISPLPISLLKALNDKDEETTSILCERLSKYVSLIRETSHEPEFEVVLMPYSNEEEGLSWDIS